MVSYFFNPFSGNLDIVLNYNDIEALGFVPYLNATQDVDLGANSFEIDENETITIGSYTLTNDGTDFIFDDSIQVGGVGQSFIASGLIVNENGGSGADDDFRVETVGVSDAFLVDASENLVQTGTGLICKTNRITGVTTLDNTYHIVFCDTDGGAFTVTLPAGIEGQNYKIINCGSTGNVLTVDPDGTEQLYGSGAGVASELTDGEVINIHYNVTEGWW